MPQEEPITSSCFDIIVMIGLCKLELWPPHEATEPIQRLFVGGEQDYYRYEGEFGPVKIKPQGNWTGRITYFDMVNPI